MSKLTAKQIDERCMRMLQHIERLLEAGEITEDVARAAVEDLAKWAATKTSRLPAAQAVEAVMTVLLGAANHDRLPRR